METQARAKDPARPRPPLKKVVVVFDGESTGINEIISILLEPRKVSAGKKPSVSLIGFADAAQLRRIVDIISEREYVPQ